MSEQPGKICCVCRKDVSNAKRVKDAKGRYFCVPCQEALLRSKPAAAGATAGSHVAAASPAPAPAAAPGDDMDLVPLAPAEGHARGSARPTAVAAGAGDSGDSAAAGKPQLPEFCPACGTKVLAGRRLCVKCNRDVTQLEGLQALREKQAAEAAGNAGAQRAAEWAGRVVKVGLYVVIVAVVGFIVWGAYYSFAPGGLWDNYPKSREAAVREFLQHIATGTEKSYDKAFMLVSFRERSTGVSGEDARYKTTFKRMHDEFAQKYGSDWLGKAQIENLGPNAHYADDEVDFRLKLDKDTYTIATQAQIDITAASANMTLPRTKKPVFNEDGKNRFGVLDIAEYPVHNKRHMTELVGSGQPEDLSEGLPDLPLDP